jgi:hypothetical protein
MTRLYVRVITLFASLALVSVAFAQSAPKQIKRQPAADAPASDAQPENRDSVNILNGLPTSLELHHDTEVGTNKPVDVFQFVIEMQVMNSDGNLEPIGLQLFNFYTAQAQDPKTADNPHNARDCRTWAFLQSEALKHRDPKSKTWPYVEFIKNANARVLQTNEDGAVYWSDDIECWGSSDRFPPF